LAISHYAISGPTNGRIISLVLGIMLLLTALSLIFRQRFLALVGPAFERVTPLKRHGPPSSRGRCSAIW
jgi:hypothetical protein